MAVRKKSQLEALIIAKMQSAINNEVFQDVKDAQQHFIQTKVYNAYYPSSSPQGYSRRYHSGGLIADENIVPLVGEVTNRKIRLKVSNVTKMSRYSNQYLAPLIVMGHRKAVESNIGDVDGIWGGGYSEYPLYNDRNLHPSYSQPRDFISATRRSLNIGGSHIRAMKHGLERQGVKLK